MPRTKQVNTYHFRVDYSSDSSEGDDEVKTRYFTTMDEVATHFNVSRSTLYNYKRTTPTNKRKNILIKNITKLEDPQPVYKKIMVHFD